MLLVWVLKNNLRNFFFSEDIVCKLDDLRIEVGDVVTYSNTLPIYDPAYPYNKKCICEVPPVPTCYGNDELFERMRKNGIADLLSYVFPLVELKKFILLN